MAESNPARRIQRFEMLVDTWVGVEKKLQSTYSRQSQVCERSIQVVPAGNADYAEALLMLKGMSLDLPVIVSSIVSVEPNNESYNKHMLRRDGYAVQINEGREWWTVVKAMPTVVTFQVLMLTDDFLTLLRMADRWMNNETWGFQLAYGSWGAKIKVTADKALSMPQRSPSAGGVEQYKLVTSMRVETYAGYVWEVPAVRAVEILALLPKGVTIDQALAAGTIDGIDLMTRRTEGATDPA